MPLFQNSVVTKYLQSQNKTNIASQWDLYKNHFLNPKVQEDIKGLKEEQYQGEFLEDLFVKILGYTKPASSTETQFNLTTEYKNVKDSKKADGAIIINESVKAVIELKGTNTTDLGKIETQAFGYKNNQPDCVYVITSNFEKLRFYIDNAIEHIEFNLFNLTEEEFNLLYLCLSFENIEKGLPKTIKDESIGFEGLITKSLYNDYSVFKKDLHQDLVANNPQYDALILFKKSQKLIDRFLFLFFGEDRQLLPPNSVRMILDQWDKLNDLDEYTPLYDRYKKYFGYLNTGFKGKQFDVFAYNGGLFKPDEILDSISINDALLYKHTLKLSRYDFASEVDVNILGHIFENSLNELDEVKAQLQGTAIDKTNTRRKKDGVFYTPKYITKYIVDNTIGKLCTEKKAELNIIEEDYFSDKKRQKKTIKILVDKLTEYRNWLLQLTICDPACGSGAFLNQALDFLITEHKYIDELQAKLFGDAMVMSDVENSILENNLFGVDLNEESVEIAKLSLWLRTAQPNRKLNDLNNNLKCGNSLIDDEEIAGDKAFSWQAAFPKIFEKGGFDVIIGNPPYGALIDKNTQQFLNNKYINGASETVISFMKLSYDLLNHNGQFSFIIPKSFTYSSNYKAIREYLINELTEIVDCKKVWSNVKLEQTIFRVNKKSNNSFYKSIILNGNEFSEIGDILKTDANKFEFLLNGISNAELALGLKIFENKIFLNDISTNQRGGSFQKIIQKEGLIKVIAGANVQRNGVDSFKGCINDKKLLADKRVVVCINSVLVQNIVSHVNNPVEHIKIISCVPDENYIDSVIIIDTVNQIVINDGYSNVFINELLNSKIINWYLFRFVFGRAIRTMHFDNAVTTRIPIPKNVKKSIMSKIETKSLEKTKHLKELNTKRSELYYFLKEMYFTEYETSKKLQLWDKLNLKQFIVELKNNSDKKIDINKEFDLASLYNANKNKIESIKKSINEFQKSIDHLLSDLYELTDLEQNIINLNMPSNEQNY